MPPIPSTVGSALFKENSFPTHGLYGSGREILPKSALTLFRLMPENTPRRLVMRFADVQHQHFHALKNPITAIRGFAEFLKPVPLAERLVETANAYLGDFANLVRFNSTDNIQKLGSYVRQMASFSLELSRAAENDAQAESMVRMLQANDPEMSVAQLRSYADCILLSSTALAEKYLEYETFAKTYEGQYFAEFRSVLVQDVVSSAVYKFVKPGGQALQFDPRDMGAYLPIQADAELLMEAIFNIISNANKYASRPSQVRVGLSRYGDWARLAVEDDGPGMTKMEAAAAFERGVRNPNRKADSSGMGLYFAREVIEGIHGGHVYIDSPRNPTRVVVLLPLDLPLVQAMPEADAFPQLSRGTG